MVVTAPFMKLYCTENWSWGTADGGGGGREGGEYVAGNMKNTRGG